MEVNQDLGTKLPKSGHEFANKLREAGIPVVASIGMLFHDSPVYAMNYSVDSADNSTKVQTLSDADIQQIDRAKLSYRAFLPQVANGINDIQSGYNTTHLGYDSGDIGYIKLPEFKQQVDLIKSQNQTEIRFGMPRWEGAKLTPDKKDIVWNAEQLSYFKEASIYAQSKGLEVFFVTTPPEVPDGFDFKQYLEISRKFYEKIGTEFPGVIHQPGNEYDTHNIFNYGWYKGGISDQQLSQYQEWLAVAVHSLRKSDPLTQVTQSLTGYPMDLATVAGWKRIDKAIGKYLDSYSLNTYASSVEEAKQMPYLVGLFRDATGKKVAVTEVGIPTTINGYTEKQQADIVSAAIRAYKDAGITVLVYQLKDEPNSKSDGSEEAKAQESFGLIRADGSKKSAFGPVTDALEQRQPSK